MGILHAFYGIGLLGPTIATTLLALGLDWRFIYLVFAGVVVMVAGTLWAVMYKYKPMMCE